jgi:hypothetical protein
VVNLGEFWDDTIIRSQRDEILQITNDISRLFNRAYSRLKEAKIAYDDWKSNYEESVDIKAINRNIVELTSELFKNCVPSFQPPRHLFAAALTPEGIVNKANSLVTKDYSIFAVKGYPGCGVSSLFEYTLQQASIKGVYVEAFHNPFDPQVIDLLVFPEAKNVLVDISTHVVDYAQQLPTAKYKRLLDFNQFINKTSIDASAKFICNAFNRFEEGLKDAISIIQTAKKNHDQLETYYVPAMDFEKMTTYRNELLEEILKRME